jgi:hypothetical protein
VLFAYADEMLDIADRAREAVRVHDLPPGQDRAQTMLIWRKDVPSVNVEALASLYRSEETSQQ